MRHVREYIAGCLVILESEREALSKITNSDVAAAVCEGKRQVLEGALSFLDATEADKRWPIEVVDTWVVDARRIQEVKWSPPAPFASGGDIGSLTVRLSGQMYGSTMYFEDLERGEEAARRVIAAWRASMSKVNENES